MSKERAALARAKRVVVKIGSRSLAADGDAPRALAEDIARLRSSDRAVLLVSSGAIAIGMKRLGYRTRPREMAKLQAAAAAGQSVLMRRYDEAFGELGLTVAQVLLTHADLADRERLNNAREALAALLEAGAIPIINENDTVATDEIRFGDNDQLASMVVPLVSADLLVLLTDVDGVLDPRGRRISTMTAESAIGRVATSGDKVGSGGMSSKLDAAEKARRSGAAVVIASAKNTSVLSEIVHGKDVGTLFPCIGEPLRARKHWIAYTLRPRGALILDPGAVHAVAGGKSSLLPVGVLGVRGDFRAGDAVRLVDAQGAEVGRGLTRLASAEVARAAGLKGRDLELASGTSDLVVVHKDDLVVAP
ncbi:MAG: glutamate 5-kinase [Polyangiaceae bacterium]|mgnify:FL=1|nr:glutamate 5-kinase [Polyangiaceae bacterium]